MMSDVLIMVSARAKSLENGMTLMGHYDVMRGSSYEAIWE